MSDDSAPVLSPICYRKSESLISRK
jgi:hypothetical protein